VLSNLSQKCSFYTVVGSCAPRMQKVQCIFPAHDVIARITKFTISQNSMHPAHAAEPETSSDRKTWNFKAHTQHVLKKDYK
jgi:hypothetical protein